MGELLADVGLRWSQGELTVAEEHIASAALQRALAAVVQSMPVPAGSPRCLLATAEGDDHTLGLSLAELCLREAGWRSEWVGGRTRSSDIVERVRHAPPRMVALSASAAMSDSVRLRAQARAVGAACRTAGIPLVLGGAGAWPAASARVRRFRAWDAFHQFLSRPA